jgi:SH3 domain-containing protein
MEPRRSRLSLWLAGIASFIATATLLSSAAAAAPRKIIGETCRVSDPEPPLNVRTTPNGSIVGTLSNGTSVIVLDYSKNKPWIFVGSEDRAPIGWVHGEYIDCKRVSVSSDSYRAFASAGGSFTCSLIRGFPDRLKPDKDPVVGTTVIIAYDEKSQFTGMEVQHELQSGAVRKRHEQYRNYRTSRKSYEEGASWSWSGNLKSNPDLSMKGELAGGEGTYYYTEELKANGTLDWAGTWSCVER